MAPFPQMADQAELEAIGALGALAGGHDDQVNEGSCRLALAPSMSAWAAR